MQKKDYDLEEKKPSRLGSALDEDKKVLFKKIAIWAGIIALSIGGLAILVLLAERGGSPDAPVVVHNLPAVTGEDIITGNPDGKVVLIKYTDFQCPACASYNQTLKTLLQEYPDDLMIVYRHFPLSIHKNSQNAARAAFSAWKLGKFEEMKDLLYENQDGWGNEGNPEKIFITYAKDIGLDTAKFETIMKSDEAKKKVEDDNSDALSMGFNSTPTFLLGNKRISPRGVDDFRILINAEIEKIN